MNIIIDDRDDKDIKDRVYLLPWYSDAVCFNFHSPDRLIYPERINDIKRPSYVKTLVIACDLDDYTFISKMKNLSQLYIYSGVNIKELSFLENLLKLQHLCVLNSHISTLDSLKKLIEKKSELYKNTPKEEKFKCRLTYGFEGICIVTDMYDSDATELVDDDMCRDEIRVNSHLISLDTILENGEEF